MKIYVNHKIINSQKRGFDLRVVTYEKIHNIKKEYFDNLINIIKPQENDNILDVGAGYGSVTKEIYNRNKEKNINYSLIDSSIVQILRSVDSLIKEFGEKNVEDKINFYFDSIIHLTHFKDNYFDKVVAKMVIHEINKDLQLTALKNIFKILKKGGKFITWDLSLDEENEYFVRKVFREKDRIAGFKSLVRNRHFLTDKEWIKLLTDAGFTDIKREYKILSPLNSRNRLEEEFKGNNEDLEEWHDYIRDLAKKTSINVLNNIKYEDKGDHIVFTPVKVIYSAIK